MHATADRASRAAELLTSIPEPEPSRTSSANESPAAHSPYISEPNLDPEEALLEAQEFSKYLLARTLFDTREYDRCAAVFLPESMLTSIVDSKADPILSSPRGKGRARSSGVPESNTSAELPRLSQRSLFLALYAKVMSGEKRRDEDAEMVMGPHDLGSVGNKQLVVVGRYLNAWFEERTTPDGEAVGSQGWLEYL